MLVLISVILKLIGVAFLCIAGLGVMRLSDPFQRMHAATKAGTLGAGLVILGSVVAQGATYATVMGILTIVFLLLTVPVAGHLLGRASYVSGAKLSIRGADALEGILERSSRPLDERMGWLPVGRDDAPVAAKIGRPAPQLPVAPRAQTMPLVSLPKLEAVRFAVIDGQVGPVAARACAIARKADAELSAHVIIDTQAIDSAEDPAKTRRLIRERASAAIHAFRETTANSHCEIALSYDEGDPERLLACADAGEVLLVLPCEGWFHHQVESRRTLTSWEPDGLLRLPAIHCGPVLFVTPERFSDAPATIVVRDRGEDHLPALLEWALTAELWPVAHIVHVTHAKSVDVQAIEGIARAFGCNYEYRAVDTDDCTIPNDIDDPRAVLLGEAPRPLRTNWFGSHWRGRIAAGMKGDVLLMERPG